MGKLPFLHGHRLNRRALMATAMAALFVPALTACSRRTDSSGPLALAAATVDTHSFARPNEARVIHIDLELEADFAHKILRGAAILTLETEPNAKQVILDTKALEILAVTDASGMALTYELGRGTPELGQPLTIELPQGAQRVVVHYQTTTEASALQWLDPSQTAGKKHPYLFSQGQEIHTRTWIPTQDSPAVRQTYMARIVVPAALSVVMSAQMLTPEGEIVAGRPTHKAYRFQMEEAIPPYLIAVAAGHIRFKETGPRTGVYAEPSVLEGAAEELSDVEAMIEAAERLYGPYRWGRYDVLIMPPSFPYGGMENPRVTFATPSILAGDKSLVSLIAHELAHSWSGNLVTNATWEDFWLNEGFTTYIENRLMEQIYGKDRADMLKVLDFQGLQETLADLKDKPNFQKLHPDLKDMNPDAYFSVVPYEKGASLLRLFEAQFGRKRLDNWLKGYFGRYAFRSLTTEAFVADAREYLFNKDKKVEKDLRLDQWLYEPGLPDNVIVPTSPVFDQVKTQIEAFISAIPPADLQVEGYVTQQWQYFLSNLPEDLSPEQMAALDAQFAFTQSKNAEILFQWLLLSVAHHYEPALPALETFLLSIGRRKFVLPLFTALMKQEGWGVEMARRLYVQARPRYHDVTRKSVDAVVNP